jgi:hypothetical protein
MEFFIDDLWKSMVFLRYAQKREIKTYKSNK